MTRFSRRSLAGYAADQLLAGESAKSIAKRLAAVTIEAGKIGDIDFLLGDIAAELEVRRELSVALATSASELTPQLRAALKNQVKKATYSRSVLLQERLDRSVLGGVRIETSARVWDNTVARKLADLREVF